MITFDVLKSEWNKDSQIDDMKLDNELVRISSLQAKYFVHFSDVSLKLKQIERDYRKLYYKKWLYYSGKMDQQEIARLGWTPFNLKVLRQDVAVFLDGDDELNALRDEIDSLKTMYRYLEDIIKSLNSRGFNLKSAVEIIKFLGGG